MFTDIAKNKLIKTRIWTIILNGRETWTIGRYKKGGLKATEAWLWKRMILTRQIEHKTNEVVLDEINRRRTIMNSIIKRKKSLFDMYSSLPSWKGK